MRLIKKVLAMSMATALTFTGIEMPVNATEYTDTQSEVVTEVQTGVENEEAVTTSDSTSMVTDTSENGTDQNTDASANEVTDEVSTTSNETDSSITSEESTIADSTETDSTTTESKTTDNTITEETTTEENSTSDKVVEEISNTQKMINDALLENGIITLSEDLNIDEMLELNLPETLEKAEITIALNGYKITSEKAQALMHVAENVTLTIKGEGSMVNSTENGIVIYNEGIVNLDNADLLATGSKSVGVLNNSTLGDKGLVIKSGTIKAELFAIGKTAKAEASLNRPTAFFAVAGIVAASTSTEETASDTTDTTTIDSIAANIEQGSYSVDENATIINESESNIEVSSDNTQTEETATTEDTTVQETDSQDTSTQTQDTNTATATTETSVDANTTTIPANQVTVVAPEIPVNVAATVISYNSIKISWSSVADAQGYIVERIQPNTESAYTELPMITATEYTDTEIAVGKEYKYRVYAYTYNELNEMLKSSASSEVTAQTSLSSPQSLTAVQASVKSAKLNWNAVEGALKYNVYRAKKGGSYKLIKTLDGTYYKDSSLKTGKKYYYKVTAVNGDYETNYSNRVSLYAAAAGVKKLKASSSVYNKINLSWKKAKGATKYKIYRSTKETSGYKRIKTLTTTKYTDKVKTGVTYYYKIVSYTKKAKGGTSTIVSATAVSAAPTNVKAVCKSYRKAKITWTKTKGARGYAIYRSTSKKSGYTLIKTVSRNKRAYIDKTVSAGTKYYYKVCAVNRSVKGKKSKAVAVKIKPSAVKDLTAKSAGGRNITLSWSASKGASVYYIYRSTSAKKGYSRIAKTTNLNYTNKKLKNGKTYYYRVYAVAGKIKSKYTQTSYVNPSKVYLSASTLEMESGETTKLTVSFKPKSVSDSSITWSSANTAIATVSRKGVVTALAAGVTTITATTCNGKTATCEVSVDQETSGIVIVLDPGHGGSDPGAVSGSLKEKDLALKISQYTKAELEKYSGVIVKMTRTTDTYLGLEQRTIIAKNYGADLFVSQHLNSASSAANGSEVFVSLNSNYNTSSTKLGSQILYRLTGLGLNNRGVKTKRSSDGVHDYYSVIRNSVSRGFPGIIIESAFISGSEDRDILSTEAGLKSIGVATATAIAENYGLSKK